MIGLGPDLGMCRACSTSVAAAEKRRARISQVSVALAQVQGRPARLPPNPRGSSLAKRQSRGSATEPLSSPPHVLGGLAMPRKDVRGCGGSAAAVQQCVVRGVVRVSHSGLGLASAQVRRARNVLMAHGRKVARFAVQERNARSLPQLLRLQPP